MGARQWLGLAVELAVFAAVIWGLVRLGGEEEGSEDGVTGGQDDRKT